MNDRAGPSESESVDLTSLASEQFCYLTTKGRVTGRPHEIEIWFGMHIDRGGLFRRAQDADFSGAQGATVYMLSGGRDGSDWVKNLMKQPAVSIRIDGWRFQGLARTVDAESEEDREARRMLLEKYQQTYSGDLAEWGRTALPVAIELEIDGAKQV